MVTKISLVNHFVTIKKFFDGFCQIQEIFGSNRWLMDG
jgi:hypothetical protein